MTTEEAREIDRLEKELLTKELERKKVSERLSVAWIRGDEAKWKISAFSGWEVAEKESRREIRRTREINLEIKERTEREEGADELIINF